MLTKCLECGKVAKCNMYSNNYAVKWFTCKQGHHFKRGYTDEEYARIGRKRDDYLFTLDPSPVPLRSPKNLKLNQGWVR